MKFFKTDRLFWAIQKEIRDVMSARERHRILSDRHINDDVPGLNDDDLARETASRIVKLVLSRRAGR